MGMNFPDSPHRMSFTAYFLAVGYWLDQHFSHVTRYTQDIMETFMFWEKRLFPVIPGSPHKMQFVAFSQVIEYLRENLCIFCVRKYHGTGI